MHAYSPIPADPADMLMAGYAAGTLTTPMHALVAGHLELSPRNRGYVNTLEAMKANALLEAEPKPLSKREAALSAIFANDDAPIVARTSASDEVFPASLRHYLGVEAQNVPWRFVMPGVKQYRIEDSERGEATLYWIRGGREMPSHTHEGIEVTLVLRGGFTDPLGHYRRGDIAVADAELDHHPQADADEDCICFAVTDAPLKLTGPLARLFRKIRGH
ncbi:MAG: ChrR family anti-sigma-E factor [Bosea sp. (in: a-proteobacteria)]